MADNYTYALAEPTSVIDLNSSSAFLRAINEAGARGSARGGYYNRFQTVLSHYDWYNAAPINTNHEQTGLTFITRPKLNLSQTSLRADETLSMLDTPLSASFPFAIRCYLDPIFANPKFLGNAVLDCPFFNSDSPFLIPLSNQLLRIDGFPQYELHTTTTPDGFFGENQTTPTGNDFGNGSYTITATFQEMDGGVISSMIFYWIHWISLMRKGHVSRYMEDILKKRLSFTSSIYRLVLDETRTRVTKWAKLTGCFPTMVSMGDFFGIPDRSQFITTTQELQVQFAVNHVEYMKPSILEDFNRSMRRQYPGITSASNIICPNTADYNYKGAPYIAAYDGSNRLLRIADPTEVLDPLQQLIDQTSAQVAAAVPIIEQMYTPVQLRSGLITSSTQFTTPSTSGLISI